MALPVAEFTSVDVVLALQTVLREEQPHAITELRRDLAEARGTNADLRAQAVDASRRYEDLLSRYMALNSRVADASSEVLYASGQLLQHELGVAVGQPSVHRVAHAREALGFATRSLDGNDRRQ